MDLAPLYEQHARDLERRYGEVLTSAGFDAVVLHSGSLRLRSIFDDQYWPLRPTPHFQHWVPLAQPDCAVVVSPGKRARLLWTAQNSIWEKPPRPEGEHFLPALDVERPATADAARDLLPRGRVAFIGEDRERATSWGLDALVNPRELVGPLDRLRTVKTPYEVECLAEANRRASTGHLALRDAFLGGDHTELELHLLYLSTTRQDDPETPYKNIVALGPSAAVLHHIDYGRRDKSRPIESLLVDAGATFQGYCSDITRTWTKGSGATMSTFAQLVNEVDAMQRRLCDAVSVGAGYETLHEESHRQVADILKTVGLSRVSAEEAVAKGITRAFFPHGLGHSLGLQTHDVGCALIKPKPEHPYLRNTSTIEPGQVFTIEPGVYFIAGLLGPLRQGPNAKDVDFALVDAMTPLGGVRVEDDLLVRGGAGDGGSSVRNLTREVV